MNIHEIITPEFEDKVLIAFFRMHLEIAEEPEVAEACKVLLKYVEVPQ